MRVDRFVPIWRSLKSSRASNDVTVCLGRNPTIESKKSLSNDPKRIFFVAEVGPFAGCFFWQSNSGQPTDLRVRPESLSTLLFLCRLSSLLSSSSSLFFIFIIFDCFSFLSFAHFRTNSNRRLTTTNSMFLVLFLSGDHISVRSIHCAQYVFLARLVIFHSFVRSLPFFLLESFVVIIFISKRTNFSLQINRLRFDQFVSLPFFSSVSFVSAPLTLILLPLLDLSAAIHYFEFRFFFIRIRFHFDTLSRFSLQHCSIFRSLRSHLVREHFAKGHQKSHAIVKTIVRKLSHTLNRRKHTNSACFRTNKRFKLF